MYCATVQVVVEFLGRTRVLSYGSEVPLSRQCLSVLAYLAVFRHLDHPRDVLIENFWASQEPSRARSCLGTALARLRKGLRIDGSNWLEVSSLGEPRIAPSAPIWFDIVAFETAIGAAIAPAPRANLNPRSKRVSYLGYHTITAICSWAGMKIGS
jgi:DNA-binding SARP family transcriptional activator